MNLHINAHSPSQESCCVPELTNEICPHFLVSPNGSTKNNVHLIKTRGWGASI